MLLVPGDASTDGWRTRGRVSGSTGADAAYRVETVQCTSDAELERRLHAHAPRVLLIDVELCERLGVSALRHLHRRHPETDWLLGWHEPSPRWVQVLLHSQARGCLQWHVATV